MIDQKYPNISKRKLKNLFINFIKNCVGELNSIDNLNDKIKFIQLAFQEENIEKKYQLLIKNSNGKV